MNTKNISKPDQLENIRLRIWMLKSRGMTNVQIGKAVGCSSPTVSRHLKKFRQKSFEEVDGSGQAELIGDILASYKEMQQEALRNMTQVEQGSPMRATWLDIAARRLTAKVKFMIDVGVLQKAADRVNMTVKDVRKMSDAEIEREMLRLKEELANTPVNFLEKREDG